VDPLGSCTIIEKEERDKVRKFLKENKNQILVEKTSKAYD